MKELQYIAGEVVERGEPLKPEALKEIRYILEGVKSGELLHDQTTYNSQTCCGTAHCIAGWKCYLDAEKANVDVVYDKGPSYNLSSEKLDGYLEEALVATGVNVIGDMEWLYAESQWGLSPTESTILFDADATLNEQFELLEVLETGYTVSV